MEENDKKNVLLFAISSNPLIALMTCWGYRRLLHTISQPAN